MENYVVGIRNRAKELNDKGDDYTRRADNLYANAISLEHIAGAIEDLVESANAILCEETAYLENHIVEDEDDEEDYDGEEDDYEDEDNEDDDEEEE